MTVYAQSHSMCKLIHESAYTSHTHTYIHIYEHAYNSTCTVTPSIWTHALQIHACSYYACNHTHEGTDAVIHMCKNKHNSTIIPVHARIHDSMCVIDHSCTHLTAYSQLSISTSIHRIAHIWFCHTCERMCDYSTCMYMHMEVHVRVSTRRVITPYTEVHTYAHTVRDHWICHMMTLGPCRTPAYTTSLHWASAIRAHRSGSLHSGVE